MLDVLEKCLISPNDGSVNSFLDLDPTTCFKVFTIQNLKIKQLDNLGLNKYLLSFLQSESLKNFPDKNFEEGTIVGLDKIASDTYRVQFLLKSGFIQVG